MNSTNPHASPVSPAMERLLAIRAQNLANVEKIKAATLGHAPVAKLAFAGIVLNEDQLRAVQLAISGQSFVLIGPAGSGKTTCLNAVVKALLAKNPAPIQKSTKWLKAGQPGIICCAPTRRAARTAGKAIEDTGIDSITWHKLIEFQPKFYEKIDSLTGLVAKTMRFEPARTALNPLPAELRTIVAEESSLKSTELHALVLDALPHNPQFIFVGDIYQLPPVMGTSILGYKLTELPVVELTRVYRQKEGSAILDFAWKLKDGYQFSNAELTAMKSDELSVFQFASQAVDVETRTEVMGKQIVKRIAAGKLDPYNGDLILCPFNIKFGTLELNKYVAEYYDKALSRQVHEVVSGYFKKYFAVGDKVLVDREDAVITAIRRNSRYQGKQPQLPSVSLSRWGVLNVANAATEELSADELELSMDDELLDAYNALATDAAIEAGTEKEERKLEASHVISYKFLHDGPNEPEVSVYSAGDVNKLDLAYCISGHKSQGSQATNVMICLDKSHKNMVSREWLYTTATRAQQSLTIFTPPGLICAGVNNQVVKGKTLKEKAEFFKGKLVADGVKKAAEDQWLTDVMKTVPYQQLNLAA